MTKISLLTMVVLILASFNLFGQQDSAKVKSSENWDMDGSSLLPDRFLFTQRILWGEKGLMRGGEKFKLSAEARERESKIRKGMFIAHQVTGFATAGAMIAQGIVGTQLYNGNHSNRDVHEFLAGAINIGYATTASLALFAPPRAFDERKGITKLKLHRALAIVHMSGMIATNVLAGMMEGNESLRPYHRAAALTTFGAFAASMIVIKF